MLYTFTRLDFIFTVFFELQFSIHLGTKFLMSCQEPNLGKPGRL